MKNIKLYVFIAAILMVTCIFICLGSSVFAGEFDETALEEKIQTVYDAIRDKRGSSYEGYCGTFLIDQLKQAKIGYVTNGGGLNGNMWFSTLVDGAVTSYGYTQRKYAGNDCLRNVISENEGAVYNVIVSFNCQYGYTEDNPGAGHALLIYAIYDGNVYFTENFEFSGIPEGSMIKMPLEDFYTRFNADYGSAIGAIHFKKVNTEIDNGLEMLFDKLNESGSYDYTVDSGTYVLDQLEALEIGYRLGAESTLGGKIYSSLEKWGVTENSFVQKKYSGNDCLYDIIDANGAQIRNVAISFKRECGSTQTDVGHAVFIYAIKDGKVFFTENFEFNGTQAGRPIQLSIAEFYETYNAACGNAVGAVHFISVDMDGYYTLKNVGSTRLLNVYDDRDEDNTKITVYEEDFTTGQYFRFDFDGTGFNIYSVCAPTRAIGLSDTSAVIAKNAKDKTWCIEKVSSGYLIRLASDPTKVLMASGKYNSSAVVVADYEEGNKYQIWKINYTGAEEMIKCYKVSFDMDGRITEGMYSYGEIPKEPRLTDYVTRRGIQYFDSWDSEIAPVSSSKRYTALYEYVYVDFEITWDIGGSKVTEIYSYGDIPQYKADGVVAYDRIPEEVTDHAEYKVYFAQEEEDGVKYYYGGKLLTGWNMFNGVMRYFSKTTGYILAGKINIGGIEYYICEDGSMYTGYIYEDDGTRYYKDGVMQTHFVEIDGKTYYFNADNGYMITTETYEIGGFLWEFEEDHSVKALEGWKEREGHRYFFALGTAITGFYEIEHKTYYFSEDLLDLGVMLTGWQVIDGKNRYFFEDGVMATGSQTVNGKDCVFADNGELESGFVTVDGKTYYYEDGKKAYGWRIIGEEYYYFFLASSGKGDGVMCTEDRVIGGVTYSFSEDGVCLNKF